MNSLQAFELLFVHGEMFTELLKLGHLEVESEEPHRAWTVLTQTRALDPQEHSAVQACPEDTGEEPFDRSLSQCLQAWIFSTESHFGGRNRDKLNYKLAQIKKE